MREFNPLIDFVLQKKTKAEPLGSAFVKSSASLAESVMVRADGDGQVRLFPIVRLSDTITEYI